ncbi:DENN domain-containing protein 1A-like isoform X2 [Coregonus clupeaformis]|uniref:DENN domain-containing protein 1A-like isoform X2 n=1 Tax=Coregonus clupeaformis TaxID=59861 RepID=UPI001E1C5653|nr:DENN domain-containing protein 1A-like isoform X2 [Coregonus clupeaformis]
MGSRIKDNPEATFEVYLEVTHPGTAGSDPEVRRRFPEDYIDQETLQTVPKFCFPFSVDSLLVKQVGQNFTFVLTDIESKQRFGFCRLSSVAHSCYCILSYLPWFEVFYKLLNILADYTIKGQESQWRELLESLHTLPIPDPGVPVHLSVHSYFTVPDTRKLPSIPESRNLTEYFVAVDVNNMLHLYASMLYERRILICCSKLSTLTACVHGSVAMMYPMYWQHVFIPVLPQHLIDYCCAPMPYLIGVHSSLMEKVRGMALDDVVVLNVDTNTLETPFDDLQSLPNDVVSSLKNRLKKVSTTTGDGVARAFLRTQAALFGSYRNALQIEPGEPITFSEEVFVTHRSSAMRQFLQNAIQLQLFKQFIDGRLELLNAGEGFRDVFEDEINMGEYAGSDKNYHQWLFTVKKGGGAIFNTVRTKANPAMKTVYKFAKDHARMGIKEVKSRLKQKELAENGYSSTADTGGTGAGTGEEGTTAGLPPSADGKDGAHNWDERRPITAPFLQARPPRPLVAKRPRSNVGLESSPEHCVRPTRHYTVFLSEDSSGDELQHEDDSIAGFPENVLFSAPFEWSPLPQPYRSLKEAEFAEEPVSGPSYTAPPSPVMEMFADINLLGDMFSCLDEPEGQQLSLARSLEDLRTPKDPQEQHKFNYQRMDLSGSERTCTLPGLKHSNPYNKMWRMHGQDDMALAGRLSPNWDRPLSVPPPELEEPRLDLSTTPSQGGCITIPRPQGRKTPEPGKVLGAPPMPEPQTKPGAAGEGGTTTAGGQEFRQALGMGGDLMLQPTKIDFSEGEDVDLLSLLDPLNNPAQTTTTPASAVEGADSPSGAAPPSFRTVFPPLPYPQSLPPFHQHMPLNPFTAPLGYPTHRHYSPTVAGNPFSGGAYRPPASAYFHATPHGHPPHPLSTITGLYRLSSPVGSSLPPGIGSMRPAFPNHGGPPPTSSGSHHALSSLLNFPSAPAPRVLPKPPNTTEDSETQDPFEDLLAMAKPAVAPPKKKVEVLRGKWETFD